MTTHAIIDIDTTIANNDHRAVLLRRQCAGCAELMGPEHRPTCVKCGHTKFHTPQGAWDKFLQPELLLQDTPQPHALRGVNALRERGVGVTFLTGRNEGLRGVTDQWLKDHFFKDSDEDLVMRPKQDGGLAASQMKERMFLDYVQRCGLAGRHFLFFEDDPYVLGMWQKYGLVFVCPQAWEHISPAGADRSVEPAWNR